MSKFGIGDRVVIKNLDHFDARSITSLYMTGNPIGRVGVVRNCTQNPNLTYRYDDPYQIEFDAKEGERGNSFKWWFDGKCLGPYHEDRILRSRRPAKKRHDRL